MKLNKGDKVYAHRAYFTSYINATPVLEFLRNKGRRYLGAPLQEGGYMISWGY